MADELKGDGAGNEVRIGFYGGTFDPIHLGHLNLALALMEAARLDEVWFCPAGRSPSRLGTSATAQHRLAMTELACSAIPGFRVIDLEIKREGPSYTIDALQEILALLRKREERSELRLLLSDETAIGFASWKEAREVIKLASPLVGRRLIAATDAPRTGDPILDAALKDGYISTPLFEVSATKIRERLKDGRYCGLLVPMSVLDYIAKHNLYC